MLEIQVQMRMSPMCFSLQRIPTRSNLFTFVNTWWEGVDIISRRYKQSYKYRWFCSSVGGHEGKNKLGARRYINPRSEESKKILSSSVNIGHGLSDKIVKTTNPRTKDSKSTRKETGDSKLQQSIFTDVRKLIVENKDLASLATFIVFDLETTGFSRSERIIEIALQDLLGGENSTFHTLVNPGRLVPNAHIHGITSNMVCRPGVPRMEQLIPVLLQFVKSRQKSGGYVVLVAHNARCFDVPFLVNEFRRCSYEIPQDWFFLDTLPLAREAMKSEGTKRGARISLQALREHYGIELEGDAHRAMSDVHSLSLVLQKITFQLKLPIATLVQETFIASELTVSNTKKKKDSR